MPNKVLVLWFSGFSLDEAGQRVVLRGLSKESTTVRLDALPIRVPPVTHYQVMAGINPGKCGVFDTVYPQGYDVVEMTGSPAGLKEKLLPNILHNKGIATHWEEVTLDTLLPFDFHSSLSFPDSSESAARCAFVKCTPPDDRTDLEKLDKVVGQVNEAVQGLGWGLFLLFSDIHSAKVHKRVNINDFLVRRRFMRLSRQSRTSADIDWENTLAYYMGHGQVWVNLVGREPQGVVMPGDEYEEVRDALVLNLSTELVDPETENPVVEKVYKKEELYGGDYLVQAPDLIVTFRPGYGPSPKSVRREFDGASTIPLTGEPEDRAVAIAPLSGNGFLMAWGGGMRTNQQSQASARLIDVAPTLLYYLGLPIPHDMDGRIIQELFDSSFLDQNPPGYEEEGILSAEEEEQLTNRLRALGYL